MTDAKAYRPSRYQIVGVLFACLVFFSVGSGLLQAGLADVQKRQFVGGMDCCSLVAVGAVALVGGMLGVYGAALVFSRVIVDSLGLTFTHRHVPFRRKEFAWETIESWSVVYDSDATYRMAFFEGPNGRFVVCVHQVEASRPSFDQFLDDVRTHVGAKERN